MNRTSALVAITTTLSIAAFGCSADDSDGGGGGGDTAMPSYATNVEPLLLSKCTPCHVDAMMPAGGLDLSAGVGFMALVGQASVLEPDKMRIAPSSAQSYIIHKLEGTQVTGAQMPKDLAALTPMEIQIIKDWIDGGALP